MLKTIYFFAAIFCSGCTTITISKSPPSSQSQWPTLPLYKNQYDSVWPTHKNIRHLFDPHTGSPKDWYVITKGYIVTNKNDTLKGYIKVTNTIDVSEPADAIPFLPFNKTAIKDIQNIEMDSVNLVKTIDVNNDTVDQVSLKTVNFRSTLWLILAEKNNIKVCYQYQYSRSVDYNNNIDPIQVDYDGELILVSRSGSRIKLFSYGFLNFHFNDVKLSILKFINKHYHQKLKENDFKDENAMINFILDNENEKEISAVKKK